MSLTPEQSGASMPSVMQLPQVQQAPLPTSTSSLGTSAIPVRTGAENFSYITNVVNQLRTNGQFMSTLQPLMKKILAPLIAKSDTIIANAQKLQTKVTAESTNESANAETQEGGLSIAVKKTSSIMPKRPTVTVKKPAVKVKPPLSQEDLSRYQTMIKQAGINQPLVTAILNTANILMQPLSSKLDVLNKLIEAPQSSLYGSPENTSQDTAENQPQEGGRTHHTRRMKSKGRKSRVKKRK